MDYMKARSILESSHDSYRSFHFHLLTRDMKTAITRIISGDHLTFRYMCFTALLAKVCDPSIHLRAVQKRSTLKEPYDARALCHKVVVPFDDSHMQGRLGHSNEPFLNNPARCVSIEKDNPVRSGQDKELLACLYDLLENLNNLERPILLEAFNYAFMKVMERDPRIDNGGIVPRIGITPMAFCENLLRFLKNSYDGEAPVAILASILQWLYKGVEVVVHPANEAGTSSNEIGDIDVKFSSGDLYAFEVKDKPFTNVDVSHAIEKVRGGHYGHLFFAYGLNCGDSLDDLEEQVETWNRKGTGLSFVDIASLSRQVVLVLGAREHALLLEMVLGNLYAMRAGDRTIRDFKSMFGL